MITEKTLGLVIRIERIRRGWSQEVLAEVCGMHKNYIGYMERGENNMGVQHLIRIAAGLEILPSELLALCEKQVSLKQTTVG